jgi:hypothetical protein
MIDREPWCPLCELWKDELEEDGVFICRVCESKRIEGLSEILTKIAEDEK